MTAGRRVDTARALTGSFPATLAALAAGAISATQALILVQELAGLAATDPAAAAAAETSLLARAPTQTAAQTRRAARRRAATADPAALAARARAAAAGRGVFLRPEPDGMATLCAVLPALEAMAAYRVLDTAARRHPVTGEDEPEVPGRRRIGDARADALLVAILGPDPTNATPGDPDRLAGPPAPPAVELAVVIDLPTLLGLDQTPAQLPGYGPLPAPVARALAGHAPWRRWVTDPVTGHLLDYGRRTYRPPTALADYIRARDTTCRFPGCARPATSCDLDHLQPYHPDRADGGPTSATNLGATVPSPPPAQNPPRLADHPRPRRHRPLDQPPRPAPPRPPTTRRPPTPRPPRLAAAVSPAAVGSRSARDDRVGSHRSLRAGARAFRRSSPWQADDLVLRLRTGQVLRPGRRTTRCPAASHRHLMRGRRRSRQCLGSRSAAVAACDPRAGRRAAGRPGSTAGGQRG